ncbi:MAG: HAD-IIA family hydrolase [Verrucomicrobiota bacterium]
MEGFEVEGILLDLSGTLYSGDKRIEGTRKCLAELKSRKLPYLFLTNTTTKPRCLIAEKLADFGIETAEEAILTPMVAAREQWKKDGFETAALFVGEDLKGDLVGIRENYEKPDVVIVGDLGEDFSYSILNQIFRLLMGGASFYALARNRRFESEGELFLDMGPFIEALAYGSGKQPICLGKPSPEFFSGAVAQLGVPREKVAVVGDDLESDVLGAMDCGLKGVLVRTGKFAEAQLMDSSRKPDAVLDSIAALPDLLFC